MRTRTIPRTATWQLRPIPPADRTTRPRSATAPAWVPFDPFVAPTPAPVIAAYPRSHVAVRGEVTELVSTWWAGGAVLEATLTDRTGSLLLAFFGRDRLGGVEVGRQLTAGGTVVNRRGRNVLLNPHLWLHPTPTS